MITKKLYFVKLAIAYNKDIAQSLQLKPNQMFLVNKYKLQAKGFKTSELRKIIQELENQDVDLVMRSLSGLC